MNPKGGISIPRPRKWRIVEFIPEQVYFVPYGRPVCELDEEILKVEEIEAIRLKDIVGLNQDECADKMKVSRPTFQRILSDARTKIARALLEGKALRVYGGDFTRHLCQVLCSQCETQWEESFEKVNSSESNFMCPKCGSEHITCCGRRKNGFCTKKCKKV